MAAALVDFAQPTLFHAAFFITLSPVFWNVVGRFEHHTRFLEKGLGVSKYTTCYIFAAIVFSLGLFRDHVYFDALQHQPHLAAVKGHPVTMLLAAFCCGLGGTWVLSSMYMLGITGTYLGDYFGILMKSRVTGFPFSMINNPMYHGSTLSFLGVAIYLASPAGVLLTCWVWTCYMIALRFEEPFTAQIYASRDASAGSLKARKAAKKAVSKAVEKEE